MEEEKYYFIKLTAQDPPNKVYVLVAIVVPENKSGIDRLDLVVAQNPDTVLIDENDSYKICRNKIQKIMLTGSPSQGATQSLLNYFKNSFNSESFMVEFFHYLEHNELEKLKMLLMQNVGRAMGRHDLDSEAKIYLTKATRAELESSGNKEQTSAKEETPAILPESIPEGSTVLDYQLILSPVTGTPISELKIGDVILVKIIPDTEEAVSIIQNMSLKDDSGIIHPCPATIVDLIKRENGTEIIVKIQENVYGRYLEEEANIKVKMYEPSLPYKDETTSYEDTGTPGERNWFIPTLILLGVLIILWIVVFFLI